MGVLTTAPWRRAPRLVWRQPAVVAAVAGGVLVLSAASAATPLFLSSSRSAVQQRQVDARCRAELGISIPQVTDRAEADRTVRAAADGVPGVATPIATTATTASIANATPGDEDDLQLPVTLMHRDGALDQVETVAEAPGGGDLWIDDTLAGQLGVGAGDGVVVGRQPVDDPLIVAGVYRSLRPALAADPFHPYWCGERSRIAAEGYASDPPPLLVLLADLAAYDRAVDVSGEPVEPDTRWLLSPTDDVGRLDRAEAVLGRLRALDRRIRADVAEDGGTDPIDAERLERFRQERSPTELEFVVQRSQAVARSVGGSIGPVTLAALATAAALVAAAGSYWVDRRRDELAMLGGRGVGPAAVGMKAALELVGPAVLGGIAGWAVALAVVHAFGPSSALEGSAVVAAARNAALAAACALAVLGIVAAVRARRLGDARPSRFGRRLGLVPWEVVPLAAALVAYRRAGIRGVPVARGIEVASIDVLALAFPLLFILGAVAVAARLFRIGLGVLRRRGGRLPTPAYLAARRLAAAPTMVVVLMAASATAVGTLTYAAQLTDSLDASLVAKARLSVGTDVAVSPIGTSRPPPAIAADTTRVVALTTSQISFPQADVIGVDPDTFARGVTWERSFAARPLSELLDQLRDPGAGPVPALVVNGPLPDGGTIDFAPAHVPDLPLAGFGGARYFPGMGNRTLVAVDRAALDRLGLEGNVELWSRGDPDRIVEAYGELPVRFARRRDTVIDVTSFASVRWTFGYLRALGLTLALIGVAGLLLYLDTRQRDRVVASAFLGRMGLSRRAARRSVLVEVAAPLLTGYLLGTGLAALAGRLILARIDPVPSVDPPPVVRYPLVDMAAVGIAAVAVCWCGAWLAQRSADRAGSAEAMRLEV